MAKTHAPYPPAFRAEAVELARTSGKGIPQLADDLGISEQALRGWMKCADIDGGRGQAGELTTVEREELRRLRREVSARAIADEALTEQITLIHERSRHTYGTPRVHAALRASGVRCGSRRVARLMRAAGLAGCRRPDPGSCALSRRAGLRGPGT